jgi:hypothetical protein
MKLKRFALPLIIVIVANVLGSCELINPEEEIPSYISIDKIGFKSNITYDTDSYDIRDAWVYIDDDLAGAYELPAKFPVLKTGRHKVTVRAGIYLNGISATRSSYPFYIPYDTTIDLEAGRVIKIKPNTTYYSNVKMVWTENFENPNITLKKTKFSDTIFKLSPNTGENYFKYGGNFSGIINLTKEKPYFECITDTFYVLPHGDHPSFLELNYKTNNTFSVSVEIHTTGGLDRQEYLTITKTEEWKKIYVNLTPVTNIYPKAYGYKIFFNHLKDECVAEAKILIDNIKLVRGN